MTVDRGAIPLSRTSDWIAVGKASAAHAQLLQAAPKGAPPPPVVLANG